jgi:N-acetylglucosaminyldiphosphoundecaprenol N-acetyl-beta-D-mannosaminyltransferase
MQSDVLIPDGIGIVLAARILTKGKIKKIAGADLHTCLFE